MVENGKRKKITKREAIVTQLVNQSAQADLRAIKILLTIQQQLEARSAASADTHSCEDITEADRRIIERFVGKFLPEKKIEQ